MSTNPKALWARVVELGAYDGGDRLLARLMPEETGPPVRLDLEKPEEGLRSGLALGVRVLCRTVPRTTREGPVQIAVAVEAVERRVGFDTWQEVWRSDKPLETIPDEGTNEAADMPRPGPRIVETRVGSGGVRRRRREPAGD